MLQPLNSQDNPIFLTSHEKSILEIEKNFSEIRKNFERARSSVWQSAWLLISQKPNGLEETSRPRVQNAPFLEKKAIPKKSGESPFGPIHFLGDIYA